MPPSLAVIWEIADTQNVSSTDTGFVLYDYIDPEALDTLVESGRRELVVAFDVEGHRVTVTGDGTVTVESHSTTVE